MNKKVFLMAALAASVSVFSGCSKDDDPVDPVVVTDISLDKPTLSLVVGKDATLTATVLPDNATDKTVTWTSSDDTKATVVDGKVTAVAAGSANITATAGGKTATCAVTIVAEPDPDPDPVAVTGISLDETTLSLVVGKDATLTATVSPDNATDKAVTWTSSDATKATVVDGKVTAVAIGSATITAIVGSKTATCEVTIIDEPAAPVVKSFSLKGELKGLKVAQGVNPQKVLAYTNPDFKGKAVAEGTLGGPARSPSRSIGGALRSIGNVDPYENDASWEIQFNNLNQNDDPQLYFAVAGVGPTNDPFMYPLNDFQVPVNDIDDGANFDINDGYPNNNPFNGGIEIECINIQGTLKVTGINAGNWPDGDWGDLGNFASAGWLMVYDANGAEIGGKMFNDYPHPVNELWTQEDVDRIEEWEVESIFGGTKPSAGDIRRPKDIVYFNIWVPARAGTVLHFDLAFGDDASGKTRANVTTFNTFSLTADKITADGTGGINGISDVDLGTGDITGVTIPNPFGGQ